MLRSMLPAFQHCHVAAHACLVSMPAMSQGHHMEACLYAHLMLIHFTVWQPRLACSCACCAGIHHVAFCEHLFSMPVMFQGCCVVAQECLSAYLPCPRAATPYGSLSLHLLCPGTTTEWRGHAYSCIRHVPSLTCSSKQAYSYPSTTTWQHRCAFCMPALSKWCYKAAWSCLFAHLPCPNTAV